MRVEVFDQYGGRSVSIGYLNNGRCVGKSRVVVRSLGRGDWWCLCSVLLHCTVLSGDEIDSGAVAHSQRAMDLVRSRRMMIIVYNAVTTCHGMSGCGAETIHS